VLTGQDLDNRALWTFLKPSSLQSCETARQHSYLVTSVVDGTNAVNQMSQCLTDWSQLGAGNPAKVEIFDETIASSPRLASVPRFAELADCGSSSCNYHIVGFSPIFMTSVYAERSSGGNPKPSCTYTDVNAAGNKSFCVHITGMADTWSQATTLEGLEALSVPCGALPAPLCVLLDPSLPGDEDFGSTFVVQLLK
jgi:hypothetical protein